MARETHPGDLSRARDIFRVLVRHGFGEVVSHLPLHRVPGLGRIQDEGRPAAPLPTARRLVRAMEEMGPTFVKLGQMLSTRGDVLPPDWIDAFAELQDRVPPFSGEAARAVIEEEFGRPVEELFASFDPEPVASASIAQVHRARLDDGREAAVKVQRPGIERTIRSDLNLLYLIAGWAEGNLDLGLYTPAAIVEAFDRAISLEVDFRSEAAHAEAFAEAMRGVEGVRVPRVDRPRTGRRVMTMEWCDGRRLSDLDATGADRGLVMDRLIEATYRQIFVHGVFHGDPHPGNLLVDDASVLTYLDFGLVGRITPEMRDTLVALFVGVVFRDADGVARTLYRAAAPESRVQLRALAAEVKDLLDRFGSGSLQDQDTSRIALEIIALARRHGLRLPQEYAILARTQVTLDGIARALTPDWDLMEAVRPYAGRLAAERLDPEQIGGELFRSTLAVASILRDLPAQTDQLMLDLERGNFRIHAATPAVDRLTDTIDRVGRALVFGVGVSAFLVSAAILSAVLVPAAPGGAPSGPIEVATTLGVVVSLLAAFALVTALMWSLFLSQRLRSVRWKRLFGLLPRPVRDRGGREDRPPGA